MIDIILCGIGLYFIIAVVVFLLVFLHILYFNSMHPVERRVWNIKSMLEMSFYAGIGWGLFVYFLIKGNSIEVHYKN